jgi:hypothetical protein
VQTIEHELGLKQGDKEDIVRRLKKQGVTAANVELYGGYDDSKPGRSEGRPTSGDRNGSAQGKASLLDRNIAAAKLAAGFRGKVGRSKAERERRKLIVRQEELREAEIEESRPRATRVVRPKGKSYIGF